MPPSIVDDTRWVVVDIVPELLGRVPISSIPSGAGRRASRSSSIAPSTSNIRSLSVSSARNTLPCHKNHFTRSSSLRMPSLVVSLPAGQQLDYAPSGPVRHTPPDAAHTECFGDPRCHRPAQVMRCPGLHLARSGMGANRPAHPHLRFVPAGEWPVATRPAQDVLTALAGMVSKYMP